MAEITATLVTEWAKIAGGALVFAIGLRQYSQAQKWKRREFVAAQIKEFEADRKIQLVMTMLDWNGRELSFPSETGKDPVVIKIDNVRLCGALLPHTDAHGYDGHEAIVRDCFDRFLEMLVRLANFEEAGLIRIDEVRPYLDYWIRLIAGEAPSPHGPEASLLLLNYIQVYNFTDAAKLIKRFGFEPLACQTSLDEAIRKTSAARAAGTFRSSGLP